MSVPRLLLKGNRNYDRDAMTPVQLKRVTSSGGAFDVDAVWAALRESGALVLEAAARMPDAFEAITEQFATRFRVHQDPARRRYVADDTTQGVSPGADAIGLHAERAYLPSPPELLFFCCAVPSTNGGATTVCDGAAIVDALSADDVERLNAMRLVWRTSLEPAMWHRMWNTDEPAHAAARFYESVATAAARASTRHWFDGETLHVECQAPALTTGWISGRVAFANYLLLQLHEPSGPQARLADGGPLPAELLRRVATVADALTVDIDWRAGDVAIIDNTRCLHGRRAFAGGERQVLVRMGDAHARFRNQLPIG
jgi:alpha-ketoglutarate-dependent taurine dioxygenase